MLMQTGILKKMKPLAIGCAAAELHAVGFMFSWHVRVRCGMACVVECLALLDGMTSACADWRHLEVRPALANGRPQRHARGLLRGSKRPLWAERLLVGFRSTVRPAHRAHRGPQTKVPL
ncbi:hypothetical protein [Burkholderia cepacia]|uniref:hypothetical protein n=1 Tax=Burkholderia cepacia TaxID=292 RepID=UPI002AB6CBB0|nr:hypothetical protein [Burkholderia cepacia]